MKKLRQSVKLNAKKVITAFEGTSYSTVIGNVDNMGISMGFLKWNFGQGTLQPLLKVFFRKHIGKAKKIMGEDADRLMTVLKSDNALLFAMEKMNNSNNIIIEPWFTYLKNICSTKEFQQIQDTYANPYFTRAASMCDEYNIHTERAFCLFFDIAVQNASLVNSPCVSELPYMDKLRKIVDSFDEAANSLTICPKDFRERTECILNGHGVVNGRELTLDINDSDAFEEDITEYVNVLKTINVIENSEYWLDNSVISKTVKGEYAYRLILKFLKNYMDFDENKTTKDPICIIKEMKLVNSTDYWYRNAVPGGAVNGGYTAELIKNMACRINKKIKDCYLQKVW